MLAGKVSSDLIEITHEYPTAVAKPRRRLVRRVGGSSQSRKRGWEALPMKTDVRGTLFAATTGVQACRESEQRKPHSKRDHYDPGRVG